MLKTPLLKIEAAVDQDGKIAAVRCRAALDLGVEAVFEGTAPGYRLEKTAQADKTAGADAEAAVGAVRRGEEEGGWVERVLGEVRREVSGLPVYVGVEGGYVYVRRTAPMDQRQFRKYTEVCRRLGFRFDRRGERWAAGGATDFGVRNTDGIFSTATAGKTPAPHLRPTHTSLLFMNKLVETVAAHLCRSGSVGLFRLTLDLTWRRLDLFAGIGAVEVVKGAAAPPTPDTETWRRAVAAVRNVICALHRRGLVHYIKEVVSWTGPSC